uniref:Uncharacterized protein n=1 Tax=Anguilla anguilla TaxID=7936 RepID=A0A0E9TQI7_ANGAN
MFTIGNKAKYIDRWLHTPLVVNTVNKNEGPRHIIIASPLCSALNFNDVYHSKKFSYRQ